MSKEDEEELSKFLAKVDQVEELVKGLVTSKDHTSTARALEKADKYIQSPAAGEEVKTSQDRTVINRTESPKTNGAKNGGVSVGGVTRDNEVSQGDFLRSLEEDAKERAERRKEREARGKEAKKKGNRVFKAGDFEGAMRCFTEGIKEAPWDITLYTNRALAHNRMSHYREAIADCDAALKFEPVTLKAYIHKGNALRSLGQSAEAEECFRTALEMFPEHADQIRSYLK